MFRIFTFLLIIFLFFFGIFQVFFSTGNESPEEKDARFLSIIDAALLRSEENIKQHTTIFSQEDMFGPFQIYESERNMFPESEFNNKQLQERDGTKGENSAQKNVTLPKANLGVLALNESSQNSFGVSDINLGGSSSDSCHGIIFDPCITASDPFFLTTGPMFLGKTPIHRYPDEVPQDIF